MLCYTDTAMHRNCRKKGWFVSRDYKYKQLGKENLHESEMRKLAADLVGLKDMTADLSLTDGRWRSRSRAAGTGSYRTTSCHHDQQVSNVGNVWDCTKRMIHHYFLSASAATALTSVSWRSIVNRIYCSTQRRVQASLMSSHNQVSCLSRHRESSPTSLLANLKPSLKSLTLSLPDFWLPVPRETKSCPHILCKYGACQRQPGNVGDYSCLRHCTMQTYSCLRQRKS